jgi:hypothetical protein
MKINEVLNKDERSTILDHNEINADLIYSQCAEAIAAMEEGFKIFKGLGNFRAKYLKTDPKKQSRISANTRNYYTLLMDNLPSWKNYPKRSQSLICTNDLKVADFYSGYKNSEESGPGNVYLVLPLSGNANFGICPYKDMWQTRMDPPLGVDIHDCNEYFVMSGMRDKNYKDFLSSVYNNVEKLKEGPFYKYFPELVDKIANLEFQDLGTIEKLFNDLYDPNRLGFQNKKLFQMQKQKGTREIWTDAESYLINTKSELYSIILRETS